MPESTNPHLCEVGECVSKKLQTDLAKGLGFNGSQPLTAPWVLPPLLPLASSPGKQLHPEYWQHL
jgi:hypothetical protein